MGSIIGGVFLRKKKISEISILILVVILILAGTYYILTQMKNENVAYTEISLPKNIMDSSIIKDAVTGNIYVSYGIKDENLWVIEKIENESITFKLIINLTKYNLTSLSYPPSATVYNGTFYLLARGGILVYNLKNKSAKVIKIENYYGAGVIPYSSIKTSSKYIAFALGNYSNGIPEEGQLCPILIYDIHTSKIRLIPTKFVLEFMDISPNGHYLSYAATYGGTSRWRGYLSVITLNLENNHTSMVNVSEKIHMSYRIDPIFGDICVNDNGKIQLIFSNYTLPTIYYYVEIENGNVTYEVSKNNNHHGPRGEVEIINDKIYMLFMKKIDNNGEKWQVSLNIYDRKLNVSKKYQFECGDFKGMDGAANFEIDGMHDKAYIELMDTKWAIFVISL